MKTLVVYYSYSGNTKSIAKKVAEELNADLLELEPIKAYSSDYDTVVQVGQEEVNRDYKPELKPFSISLNDYEKIIIGSPTWWYKMASPVLTFLSENDLSGKVVVPFMTNAGWPGTVIKDMKNLCGNSKIEYEKEIKFTEDKLITPEEEINQWIEFLK